MCRASRALRALAAACDSPWVRSQLAVARGTALACPGGISLVVSKTGKRRCECMQNQNDPDELLTPTNSRCHHRAHAGRICAKSASHVQSSCAVGSCMPRGLAQKWAEIDTWADPEVGRSGIVPAHFRCHPGPSRRRRRRRWAGSDPQPHALHCVYAIRLQLQPRTIPPVHTSYAHMYACSL